MLNLAQIKKYTRERNISFSNEKALLTEYLQCEILLSLYNQKQSQKLHFIGGTCLRLLYDLPRFSEDLDFDNLGLKKLGFNQLVDGVKKDLNNKGFSLEVRKSYKGAFHAYFKFKNLLYNFKLSPLPEQKILVRLDTAFQNLKIKPEVMPLDKYGIFQEVLTNPLDLIFSQKILALLQRKRALGRDFYDFLFLAKKKIKPDFKYLEAKFNIQNKKQLKQSIITRCKNLNFKNLSHDVKNLLFNPKEKNKVEKFKSYLKLYF